MEFKGRQCAFLFSVLMQIKLFVMTAVRPEADPGGFESFDKTAFVGQKKYVYRCRNRNCTFAHFML